MSSESNRPSLFEIKTRLKCQGPGRSYRLHAPIDVDYCSSHHCIHNHFTMADANGNLVCVIGDQDTVAGFILAGVGEKDAMSSNFFVVDTTTEEEAIEKVFKEMTQRKDVGIVLINQHIANVIRHTILEYTAMIPTILEIPSKDHPYEGDKDTIQIRVNSILGITS